MSIGNAKPTIIKYVDSLLQTFQLSEVFNVYSMYSWFVDKRSESERKEEAWSRKSKKEVYMVTFCFCVGYILLFNTKLSSAKLTLYVLFEFINLLVKLI